ncbi:MAG TPA: hypothetical protein VIF57_28825, partial [Polyangia bacterium]
MKVSFLARSCLVVAIASGACDRSLTTNQPMTGSGGLAVSGAGGGVAIAGAALTLRNTIVANNTAPL